MSSGGEQMRLFSLDEARALLPALRDQLLDMQQQKQKLDQLRGRLRSLSPVMRSNGHSEEAADLDRDIRKRIEALREQLEELMARGILVKDLDEGIIDFPHRRDGEIVLLCWKLDEPDIRYWHDFESGFNGRRPL